MVHILGLLGMHFDAVVVEVKTFFLLLFRLTLAILCATATHDDGMYVLYYHFFSISHYNHTHINFVVDE